MPPEQPIGARSTRVSHIAVTGQIVSIVFFTFICYLTIGLPLAFLPGYVHMTLGYGSVLAGVAISLQYVATLISRPLAGRMADAVGPRQTVLYGLAACGLSGVLLFAAALTQALPGLSLALLLGSRLVLGFGESWVGTGSILWGIGKVGTANTARVISWNGITTYGGLAIGAPLGVVLAHTSGFAALGVLIVVLAVMGLGIAAITAAVPVVHGERLAFRLVFSKVLPHGIGLALGSVGFGAIATFITLFYASHDWPNAALSLTVFGTLFIGSRLLLGNTINMYGGFRVAIASFAIEALGLALLWIAASPQMALIGAAFAGFGFALIFPSLGVEAVGLVPPASRGAALSAYSVFLDLSLGITGPLAGLIAGQFGYASVFLFAALASVCAVGLTLVLYLKSGRTDATAPA